MAYLIDRIQESLAKEGITPRTQKARTWLSQKISSLNASSRNLMQNRKRLKDDSVIGKMYFFYYDAKTKDSLPYYDRFPLVIPIEQYQNGFLGLNLHYIHPKQRIILLDNLSNTLNNNNYNETTKLRINYDYLTRASRVFQAMPCIKRYLYSNITSRFLEISADEWDIAALLPVENFVGANSTKVYSDSRKKF
jgi:hypothetical protein